MKAAKKHPGGRPSKYKPEYCEQAYKFCLLGCTDVELSDFFGITERTLNRWKHDHSEFCQSLKDGKENADNEVAQSLYNKAVGGDTTAMIFWLKNRRKAQWRDKQEHEHSGKIEHEHEISPQVKKVIDEIRKPSGS
jgi:hypothetical protein